MKRVFWLVTLSAAHLLSGQTIPQSSAAPLRATSTLVLVPTLVRSASGQLVFGLKASDFSITDNGVAQKVELDETEREPVSILVVMQTGASAARQFAYYRNLPDLLDDLAGSSERETAVMTFDSMPEDMWSFSPNASDLNEAFQKPVQGDRGAALLDALNYAADLFKEGQANTKRIILLLSQPQDDGSEAHAEDVVRRLEENNITVFSVAFSPEATWLKDQFTKPLSENPPYKMPDHPDILHTFSLSTPLGVAVKAMQEDTATEVANLSGGEHVRFDSRQTLEQQLSVLANHIPNRYRLSFHPASTQPGFHSIHVGVVGQGPSVSATARTGYWAVATPSPQ